MGIYVHTDRTLAARDKEKDTRIKELEADNMRLEAQEGRLTAQNRRLADENVVLREHDKEAEQKISDLASRLGMAHEVETNQAEVIAAQKQTIADLEASHDELEQAYIEANKLFEATASFLERIALGGNIRTEQRGGRELITQAKALLKQYGHDESQS